MIKERIVFQFAFFISYIKKYYELKNNILKNSLNYDNIKNMEKDFDYSIVGTQDDDFYSLKAIENRTGEICGSISFGLKYKERHAWLQNIEVKEDFKKNGIGQALLTNFENICVQKRLFTVEGKFYPKDDHAKSFYEKNNYKIEQEDYGKEIFKRLDPESVADAYTKCAHRVEFVDEAEMI